jgi:anti-sigma-K factor RskA
VNVQDYISSGIVESYVLGLSLPKEQAEFESMCRKHPEVLEARIAFELLLEQQAMQNAIEPPAMLKQRTREAALHAEARLVPLTVETSQAKINWFKYAAAACAVLLAGSVYWNISQYNKNKELRSQYNNTIAKLSDVEKDLAMLVQNPNVKMAAMKGMEVSPASYATVYWDTTSKDVYLLVNNLPKPANDKQYQLWALLDGKPVDVGMIDNSFFVGQKQLLLRMKNASGAQAFAITLEKQGGNSTPQGPMYTMGSL